VVKLLNRYFPGRLFVLLVSENVLILLGIWIAVSFQTGSMRLSLFAYPTLFAKAMMITVICQTCLYYADIYDVRNLNSRLEVVLRLVQALGAAALILAFIFYLVPSARLGVGIVETSLLSIVVIILMWRVLMEWVNRAYGSGERILLVGSGEALRELTAELSARRDLPINVVGLVPEPEEFAGDLPMGVKRLGDLDDLGRVIDEVGPDRLVISLRERRRQLPLDLLLHHRMRGLLIEEVSTMYQKVTGKIPVESIHPSSLIFSDGFQQSTWRQAWNRGAGFMCGLLALALAGPFMLLIALVIKLDSKGPALYRQTRVGKDGTTFECLKFRSMRTDAESATGPVWAGENDPRITRVGRILRTLRLDELPQFINVLKGEMSFVGPRPERPHFVDKLKQQIPFYDLRHSIRPGITGWAQVSCHYGATIEESREKLEYDLFYIKNNSFSFDMLIMFWTVKIMLFGRGAR
jgi:sugar transferase (PEP-CTERM system associated)